MNFTIHTIGVILCCIKNVDFIKKVFKLVVSVHTCMKYYWIKTNYWYNLLILVSHIGFEMLLLHQLISLSIFKSS